MGVLSLKKKVGRQRLTNACKRDPEFNIHNYEIMQNILEKNLDNIGDDQSDPGSMPDHYNIRGSKYFQ
jgi:hypothetical protein